VAELIRDVEPQWKLPVRAPVVRLRSERDACDERQVVGSGDAEPI
jgi:hypothetical protein